MATSATRATRAAGRLASQVRLNPRAVGPIARRPFMFQYVPSVMAMVSPTSSPTAAARSISSSRPLSKGLSPESEDPKPKEAEPQALAPSAPASVTIEEYHELSDKYIDQLVEKLEALAEQSEEIDCDYSAGVLNFTFPPHGSYVINKQPPNKQIWLSSPVSGPKRYDFVMSSEGQDAKEGTGTGDWVYLRDGSSLNEVLRTEIGIDMLES
ncbi:mitochondrial iron uptake protein [Amylocarpus encephaloides]|uniref:ferroxidase n=1 Tax=Amylocarpus encephaloides TaxID=45428 RepID=A0A9P8C5U0_9HELO|nr:mitochondrial iron uptake protein [Amylocarpus encephaloides]